MRLSKIMRLLLPLAFLLGLSSQLFATTIVQMNLNEMTANATSIFRGTVIDIQQITVEAGGGELPALHYKVRVDELFKGDVQTVKDEQVAEFKILGRAKDIQAGNVLPGFPLIQSGQEYLLFVGAAGPIGLSTTTGLGQGCFSFLKGSSGDMVVNAFNNMGLFKGMDAASMPDSGPAAYSDVADMIRSELGY